MSVDLPISKDTNKTGRLGVTILQKCVESEGWVFRRQDGDDDFGIDGEIEIVNQNKVTGWIAKFQVKSSANIEFEGDAVSVSVKTTTYNLWCETPLLTILFYVDTTKENIFWTPALAHHPKHKAESLSVKFEEASNLRLSLNTLRSYLDSWFAVHSNNTIFREIPPFHRIYDNFLSDVDHSDDWSEMDEEDDNRFRLFYRHVLRLRLEMGLLNDYLPSLDDWYCRNFGLWNDDTVLFWGTFSEAMKIIGPAYEEVVDKIIDRLGKADLTFENQELWNFLNSLTNKKAAIFQVINPRASDDQFHADIEAKLDAVGALKYRFSDKSS